MEWIFGIAIGFLLGVIVKHVIEVWNKPMDPLIYKEDK